MILNQSQRWRIDIHYYAMGKIKIDNNKVINKNIKHEAISVSRTYTDNKFINFYFYRKFE